jgi:hypothetical protein
MALPQPGEWYARRTHADGYVTHLVSLDSEPIKNEYHYGRNIAVGLSGQHAHLIAAAPDLLAACETAYKLIIHHFDMGLEASQLAAAIAKAKAGLE